MFSIFSIQSSCNSAFFFTIPANNGQLSQKPQGYYITRYFMISGKYTVYNGEDTEYIVGGHSPSIFIASVTVLNKQPLTRQVKHKKWFSYTILPPLDVYCSPSDTVKILYIYILFPKNTLSLQWNFVKGKESAWLFTKPAHGRQLSRRHKGFT